MKTDLRTTSQNASPKQNRKKEHLNEGKKKQTQKNFSVPQFNELVAVEKNACIPPAQSGKKDDH